MHSGAKKYKDLKSALTIKNQHNRYHSIAIIITNHLQTQAQTHILPYLSNVSKPVQNACFGELEVVDKCNESAVSQLSKVGTMDGAATHKAPLRAPLELVPFTGKEKDSETGFCYFGARYYDSDLSGLFLSIDPMSDKYPNISPYAYCAWNPVKLVDPDGNDWFEIVNEETGEKEIKWTDYHSQKEMDDNKQAGTYLGEVFVQFNGSSNESLGDDNKMTGEGANPATVTIYGKNNEKDIHTYNGMTTPYSDSYSTLDEGDYRAYYEDMATSVYGEAGA